MQFKAVMFGLEGTISNMEDGTPEGTKVPGDVLRRLRRYMEELRDLGMMLPEAWPGQPGCSICKTELGEGAQDGYCAMCLQLVKRTN
jgi:hypothetical protein